VFCAAVGEVGDDFRTSCQQSTDEPLTAGGLGGQRLQYLGSGDEVPSFVLEHRLSLPGWVVDRRA